MATYKHTPLQNPGSTRLLYLEPSRKLSAPLKCTIRETALSSALPYQALSYVWGDPCPPSLITVQSDGQQGEHALAITSNCEAALRRLRDPRHVRALWVDAICIDQTSTDDKSVQVPMMRDIYAKAAGVAVWLGELEQLAASSQSVSNFRSLFRLMRVAGAMYPNGLLRVDAAFDDLPDEGVAVRMCERYVARKTERLVKELNELCRNPYFQRVWTMQEVAVAPKDAIYVHAGQSSVSWRDLCVTASFAAFSLAKLETFRDGMLACCLESHFVVMKNLALRRLFLEDKDEDEDGSVMSSQTALKSHILVYLKGLHATEPRDKVYAILFALTRRSPRDADEIDSNSRGANQEITVDYTKSTEAVFTEFTTFILNHAEGPYRAWPLLLACRGRGSNHQGLPSWVPDWAEPKYYDAHMRFASTQLHHSEPGTYDLKPQFSPDLGQLRVWGRRHSSIVGVFSVPQGYFASDAAPAAADAAAWKQSPWPDKQTVARCYGLKVISDILDCHASRTPTADEPSSSHPARETSRPVADRRSPHSQLAYCLDPFTYEGPDKVEGWKATARERELASAMGVGVDAIRLCILGDLLDLRKRLASRNGSVTRDMWLSESAGLLRTYLKEGVSTDDIRGRIQSRSGFSSAPRDDELGPVIEPLLDVLDVVVALAEMDLINARDLLAELEYDMTVDQAFFVTDMGQIGRSFASVEVGDTVTTWQGMRVAFVLRAVDGNEERLWTLASAANVLALWAAESVARDGGYKDDEMFVIV
ncbi:hypothetical protein MAPG_07384 [Magnaporthiopsis poae ATCC 64411]|uniref:Heterokaryon incompatibility domain-containing protein n=1 Tax=Magnaporthiopsis poae (strain ATCC 64411 / 73-15) TaxID=644358 RepID=A0A0C4E4J0_MAGP6|nr:hypothetical protein MAPG_07384 [Magnaporthiopsis poae ATCC 64411]